MAIVFFAAGVSVSNAKGDRILAAFGRKLNEDGSGATVAQVEDWVKAMIQNYTHNVELRETQAAALPPAPLGIV